MKVNELLRISKSLLDTLNKCGVKALDVDYLQLYDDYLRLKEDGFKITYIVEHLGEEYSISVRSVFMIIKKFETDI